MSKKKVIFGVTALMLVALLVPFCAACPGTPTPPTPPTRAIDPFVSTQWLANNIDTPGLVLLDVRDAPFYEAGHIPGSPNLPALGNLYLCLFEMDCGLWMERPTDAELFTAIGSAGITADSTVVVIGRTVEPYAPYAVADAARAAITLIYAGVEDVTLLSGGYDKWAAEGRATTTAPVTPTAVTYTGTADAAMFVSMDYVASKVGKSTLVEGRECDIYYGIIQEPWTTRAGHIPTAKNLPAPWFWATTVDDAGVTTYIEWNDVSAITEMATTVLGNDGDEEIISYCGVGGYAAPVWYVLTQVVGYRNVKIYDGSMQEWSADPSKQVNKYKYG
jgi:thiosulfate/3-mercaptopyruvate sulfurtransferase